MVTLYIVSLERAAGKTAICAGIGRYLLGAGKKVGFLKPITGEGGVDGDAAFMKGVLSLPETADSLCPVIGGGDSAADKIKEACDKLSANRDVVMVEGMIGPGPDDNLSKASYEIARALNARVIIVDPYSARPAESISSYKGFGENLFGLVLNKVPASQLKRVRDKISAHLGGTGITLLGIIPEDRVLLAPAIGELADSIHGEILNHAEKSAELVENLMLGAMCVDSGLEYYGRKTNKAAVIRGDRPDMQMAALETSTKCLVISGSKSPPIYSVLQSAENKGIPIVLSDSDTSTIVANIEGALVKARFNQPKKLPKLDEVVRQHLNLKALLQ